MVDALVSKTSGATRVSSTLTFGTIHFEARKSPLIACQRAFALAAVPRFDNKLITSNHNDSQDSLQNDTGGFWF
jgi:hypothetical protein